MSTLSMIHNFLRLGTNFLKIRSDTKAITAVSKQKPVKIPVMLTWLLYPAGFFSISSQTASTRQMEDTIFSGVNFTFNSLSLLKPIS